MKTLNRKQMKSLFGGVAADPVGSCASINAGGEIMYNLTREQASGVGAGGHWCCSSCSTASWYCEGAGEMGCPATALP